MADNIDDFLRRAAERRQQRAGKAAPSPPPPQRSEPPPRQLKASPPPTEARQQVSEGPRPVQQPPAQLHSSIESRQALAQSVESADDVMREHLQNVFVHQLGNIPGKQQSSSGPVTRSPKPDNLKPAERPAEEAPTASLAQLVVAALRDPQTTKIAFVASEIFKRRF